MSLTAFHANLKRITCHRTHDQFVREILSVDMLCTDMAIAPVFSMHDLRDDFRDEMWQYVFRDPSGL